MKNPCDPKCPRRSETCHGTCPDYDIFWNKCEERRNLRAKENDTKDMREGLRKRLVQKAALIRQGRAK